MDHKTILVALLSSCSALKMELTPFGYMPAECVNRAAPGTRIKAKTPHEENPVCLEFLADTLLPARQAKQQRKRNEGNTTIISDGWLDYISMYTSYTGTVEVGYFEGTYTIPEDPVSDDGQVLFYFIGTENYVNSDTTGLVILQPVLTWGNGHRGWNMASWNCCPSGESYTSDFITDMTAGTTAYGNISIDGGVSTIVSTYEGQAVTLAVDQADREFNWMDVTLEEYDVSDCSQFSGPQTIYDMSAYSTTGEVISPSWTDSTGSTGCGGYQTFDEKSWTVTHSG